MKLLKVKTTKKADADGDPVISTCDKNARFAAGSMKAFEDKFRKDSDAVVKMLFGSNFFDTSNFDHMKLQMSSARRTAQELADTISKCLDSIERAYKQNIRSVE